MARWKRSLLFALILECFHAVLPDCITVNKVAIHCISDAAKFAINCPLKHQIVIVSSTYWRPQAGTTCPPPEDALSSSCQVISPVAEIQSACHRIPTNGNTCKVEVSPRTSSKCAGEAGSVVSAEDYVRVVYHCEATVSSIDKAKSFAISQAEEFTVTLANINSHPQALLGQYIEEAEKTCTLDVPAGNEVRLSMLYFLTSTTRHDCSQRVLVYDDEAIYEFCDFTTDKNNLQYVVPCRNTPRTLYIRYLMDPALRGVSNIVFVLQAKSAHDSVGIHVTCAVSIRDIPFTPLVTNPIYVPTTQPEVEATSEVAPSSAQVSVVTNSTSQLPIIIGCTASALLVLIIIALVGVHRRRQDQKSSTKANTGRHQRVIGSIYVEGETSASLTIDSKFGVRPF